MSAVLRIAARRSDLARLQAIHIGQLLKRAHSGLALEFLFSESLGDKNQHDPLWKMPEKGVFTSDLSAGLAAGRFDLVVHSWKDLPLESDRQVVGSPSRADARDVILFDRERMAQWRNGGTLVVLSSSPRRELNLGSSLKGLLPEPPASIQFVPVRGNIATRVRKLLAGESGAHALVVAKAAIDRLLDPPDESFGAAATELRAAIARCRWMVMPLSIDPCAPAQGALAIEARADDARVQDLVAPILCCETTEAVRRERAVLAQYGGGCHQAIGVSVQPTPWGAVKVVRGRTAAGEALNERVLASARTAAIDGTGWSTSLHGVKLFDREILDSGLERLRSVRNGAWFVSHMEALPATLTPADLAIDTALWCAGLASWRSLAARGFWVMGCDDGLGETTPNFDRWFGEARPFVKLGHSGSPELGDGVATYRLVPRTVPEPRSAWRIGDATHFYWRSVSQFERVIASCPELLDRHHGCGPGATARLLSSRVRKLEVCLDESDWRARHGIEGAL